MSLSGYSPGPGRRLVGPPAEPTAEPWEREEGVLCVSCPVCAFTFDSIHTSEGGSYSCPQCERDVLARRVAVLETVAEAAAVWRELLREGEWLSFGDWTDWLGRCAVQEAALDEALAALSAAGAATDQGDGEA